MAFKVSNVNIIDDSRNLLNALDGSFTGIATASRFVSNVAQGTAPISVASSTLVTDLNANFLGGFPGAYYQVANNLTGTAPGSVITQSSGLTVSGNLNVSGNVSIGGTTTLVYAQQLQISDRDITLGVTTAPNGDDISTDITANHGGVSIASTVGTPIIGIPTDAVNNSPSTYKQIMWIRQNHYSGFGTDAWLFNYGVSIGNTATVQNGSRLTVGAGFTVYDNYIDVQDIRNRNINTVGVGTITNALGTNLNFTGIGTITNARGTNANYSGIATAATYFVGATKVFDTVNSLVSLTGIQTVDATTKATFEYLLAFAPNNYDDIQVTGLSTFVNGPVLVGTSSSISNITLSVGSTTASRNAYISGNLGIGVTVPLVPLHVDGNALVTGVGTITTLNSTVATLTNLGGTNLNFTGVSTLTNATGTNINFTGIGTIATLNSTVLTATNASGTNLNYTGVSTITNLGGTNINYSGIGTVGTLYVTTSIGINSTAPSSSLDIIGNAKIVGIITATDFNSSSDEVLKDNITQISDPIQKVLQINGVTFNWKADGKPSMGVIAQEIEKVMPELVSDTEPKSVNYNGLIGLLIECIKDQQKQIDDLKTKKTTTRRKKTT
jgi:hypothetical protein